MVKNKKIMKKHAIENYLNNMCNGFTQKTFEHFCFQAIQRM